MKKIILLTCFVCSFFISFGQVPYPYITPEKSLIEVSSSNQIAPSFYVYYSYNFPSDFASKTKKDWETYLRANGYPNATVSIGINTYNPGADAEIEINLAKGNYDASDNYLKLENYLPASNPYYFAVTIVHKGFLVQKYKVVQSGSFETADAKITLSGYQPEVTYRLKCDGIVVPAGYSYLNQTLVFNVPKAGKYTVEALIGPQVVEMDGNPVFDPAAPLEPGAIVTNCNYVQGHNFVNITSLAPASGAYGNYAYSWEKFTGTSWTLIAGATGTDCTISVQNNNTFMVRRKVTSGAESGYSNICVISKGLSVSNENYIHKTTYNYLPAGSIDEFSEVSYFDGLGRPIQTIQVKAGGNGADLVTYQEYDTFGRESNAWLPVWATGNNGAFIPLYNFTSKASSTYPGDAKPYSKPIYEASPLNRIIEQYGPGELWYNNSRSVKNSYLANNPNIDSLNCVNFTTTSNGIDTVLTLTKAGNYYDSELFVNRTENEDGKGVSFEFRNKLGQLVLSRQILRNGGSNVFHDTYYVYDDFGNLAAVLPPEASARFGTGTTWSSASDAALRNYAYLYIYDGRNRCTAKKLPGADWNFYVYDKADRVVATQDGNMRANDNSWILTKYDTLGRVVRQESVTNKSREGVTGNYSGYYGTGELLVLYEYGSSNTGLYDDLEFQPVSGDWSDEDIDWRIRTLKTYEMIKVLDETDKFVERSFYYDYRGRVIQIAEHNHLGGISRYSTKYDFAGNILRSHESHWIPGKTTDVLMTTNTYDNTGRLLTSTSTLNSGAPATIKYTYNELGQLKNKFYGNNNHSTYEYNIRNWLVAQWNTKFIQVNVYNTGNWARFNGNIAETHWGDGADGLTHSVYAYTYDDLNRLTEGWYFDHYGTNYYEGGIKYDKNGNILTLRRHLGSSTSYNDFAFKYNGNQLASVNSGVQFTYDRNGNQKTDAGSTLFKYNYLNLCEEISNFGGALYMKQTYTSDGLKRTMTGKNFTLEYLGSLIYRRSGSSALSLDVARFADGVIRPNEVDYFIKDHLGSIRVIVDNNGNVLERNDFYPFGLKMTRANQEVSANNQFMFSGKEDLEMYNGWGTKGKGWYDFGARIYYSTFGRFDNPDPLSERRPWESPYAFCGNNPVNRVDPTGLLWDDLKEARELQSYIDKQLESVNRSISNSEARLEKGGLSDKKIARIKDQISESEEMIKNLNTSRADIDRLGADQNHTYAFSYTSGGEHKVRQGENGKVLIETSSNGMSIHEITHVRQSLDAGGLRFYDGQLLNVGSFASPSDKYKEISKMEVEAYRMQYSFDRSFPGNLGGMGLRGIDIHSVGAIMNNGNPVYPLIQTYSTFLKQQQKIIGK